MMDSREAQMIMANRLTMIEYAIRIRQSCETDAIVLERVCGILEEVPMQAVAARAFKAEVARKVGSVLERLPLGGDWDKDPHGKTWVRWSRVKMMLMRLGLTADDIRALAKTGELPEEEE